MITSSVYIVASAYGSGQYDRSAYNGSTTTTASGGSSQGSLSDTGVAVISIVTLAAIILFVALAVRIWKRPSKKVAAQEAETDDSGAER